MRKSCAQAPLDSQTMGAFTNLLPALVSLSVLKLKSLGKAGNSLRLPRVAMSQS